MKSNDYGVFDKLTHPQAFEDVCFEFDYINRMRLTDQVDVVYLGSGSAISKVVYLHDSQQDARSVEKDTALQPETILILHHLGPAREYERQNQSISLTQKEIRDELGIVVKYDSICFTAGFLHCKRIAAELTKDQSVYALEFEIRNDSLYIHDTIDDNHFSFDFKGDAPSVADVLTACSQAFVLDHYKVMI